MAIRLGSPSGLARLRLQWHTARTQYQRQQRAWSEQVEEWRSGTRVWWQQTGAVTLSRLNLRERSRRRLRERRKVQLDAFTTHYEQLVDLLCWAAKEGASPEHARKYAALREWMQSNYGAVRPYVRPYLDTPANVYDPFESLYAPQNIEEIINDLSGIENVMTTRAALEAYRDEIDKGE